MIRHETLTLLVTLGTVIATVWLYIVIPKGFLPQQDTGLIFAVMEGGQEVSFTEMKRLQSEVETAIRKDPEVTGVVSVIGVTPLNATPECRPHRHHAALARRARDAGHDRHRTAAAGRRRHSGHRGVFPAGAGHPDFDPAEPRAVPVHADRHRHEGSRANGPRDLRNGCKHRR